MSDRHAIVSEWADIEYAPDVSDRDKQRVATILSEQSWVHVVWLPAWLLEDRETNIATVEASEHLAVGDVEDYSEKAWAFSQPHRRPELGEMSELDSYLPKSQVIVFERLRGVDAIETPQMGLAAFAGGSDDE